MFNTHLYNKNENKPLVKIQQPKDNKPLDYETIKKIVLEKNESKHESLILKKPQKKHRKK